MLAWGRDGETRGRARAGKCVTKIPKESPGETCSPELEAARFPSSRASSSRAHGKCPWTSPTNDADKFVSKERVNPAALRETRRRPKPRIASRGLSLVTSKESSPSTNVPRASPIPSPALELGDFATRAGGGGGCGLSDGCLRRPLTELVVPASDHPHGRGLPAATRHTLSPISAGPSGRDGTGPVAVTPERRSEHQR